MLFFTNFDIFVLFMYYETFWNIDMHKSTIYVNDLKNIIVVDLVKVLKFNWPLKAFHFVWAYTQVIKILKL